MQCNFFWLPHAQEMLCERLTLLSFLFYRLPVHCFWHDVPTPSLLSSIVVTTEYNLLKLFPPARERYVERRRGHFWDRNTRKSKQKKKMDRSPFISPTSPPLLVLSTHHRTTICKNNQILWFYYGRWKWDIEMCSLRRCITLYPMIIPFIPPISPSLAAISKYP